MAPKFHHRLLALAVASLMIVPAWADDSETTDDETSTNTTHLGTLKVTTKKKAQQGKLGERTISRQQLNEENIQNAHDLVRYNTEVDVAEVGRYGNKGFAVRGVDGNRVAMNIDGMALPEVEVNEIFSPYGYQYEGRFNPDIEMMGGVRVTAGSDSLISGSGAVGGAISYSTKEPYHLVRGDKSLGGYVKLGYTSKNEEKLASVGLAGIYNRAEFLLNYSRRDGHELKNHDMKKHDKAKLDPAFQFSEEEMPGRYTTLSLRYPDPLSYKSNSVLAKFYYNLTDEHRVGVHGMHQERTNHMNAQSKHVFGYRTSNKTRFAHDKEELKSYGVNYHYTPNNSTWLDNFNMDYTRSKILGLADTWEYDLGYPRGVKKELDYREYRPINNDTNKISLSAHTLPFDFGKMGEHQFYLKGDYSKQDYRSAAHYLKYKNNEPYTPDSFVNFAFTDAKKNIYSLTLGNNIRFNDRLKASVGVRYDNLKYKPYYQGDQIGTIPTSLTEEAKIYGTCISNRAVSVFCDAYRAGTHNKTSKFNHFTWNAMFDYNLIADKLAARYKVGTGFLAPTVTQIYHNFTINSNEQVPNFNLKPETSLTHELEFEFKPKEELTLTLGGYTTKYNDFIHTKYWNSSRTANLFGCSNFVCLQSANLDKAEVTGLKLGAIADLSTWSKLNGKLDLTADYHFSKDKALITTDYNGIKEVNTLAAVPGMLILGLNYYAPNNDWEIHSKIRYSQAKKSSNAKYLNTSTKYKEDKVYCKDSIYAGYCSYGSFYDYDPVVGDYYKIDRVADGYTEEVKTFDVVNRSESALLWDIYGSKKFGKDKNWIVNAGVYNITNEKYIPWETLRQFATTTINSMVDEQGNGFNRYTAPGRNFALSLTYEF